MFLILLLISSSSYLKCALFGLEIVVNKERKVWGIKQLGLTYKLDT